MAHLPGSPHRIFPVVLNDQPKSLRFDMNALVAFEEAVGKPLSDIDDFKSLRTQRALVWAGLLHEDPTLQLATVGKWLTPLMKNPQEFNEIITASVEAYGAAFPEPKDESKNALAGGTGNLSGSSPVAPELETLKSGA